MGKILAIKQFPEKILRKKCLPIADITENEVRLFQDMLQTMCNFSGIGLAAPQVGIDQQLFVADIGEGPIILANPKVLEAKGKEAMEEGCLSVPGAQVNIARPYEIIIQGLNEKGQIVEIKAKGLLARVCLHEIDHLKGRLIVDYMNLLEKTKYRLNSIVRKEDKK